jgi:hypothetical protein
MTELLSQICALQKTYGKNQAEIETLADGFCWILQDYGIEEIKKAMREYILTKNDVPAPADILAIIKETRYIESINLPDIGMLKKYKAKGIKLTPAQENLLNSHN